MNPYERIYERARQETSDAEFAARVGWYMQYGFLFATPDFFIMGKVADGRTDCWYIEAMAGDMAKAWSILPHELPWIAFERTHGGTKELQFVRIEDLRRLTHHVAP